MSKQLFKRIVCVCTVCVMFLSATSFQVFAKSAQDFENQINDLENQIAAQNDKINQNQQSADELLDQIDLMQQQLNVYNEKIAALNKQIAEKNEIINQYQKEIDALQAEIDEANKKQAQLEDTIADTYDLLADRLCANYMAGETSVLEILLGAGDFEDFLTRLELVKQISDHDASLVSDLQKDIDELNQTKEKLDTDKAAVEEKQTSVQSERDAIASVRSEQKSASNTLETKQSALEQKNQTLQNTIAAQGNNVDALEEQLAKAEAEYDAWKAQGMENGSGSISGGSSGGSSSIGNYPVSSKGMICPLQYSNVTISAGWYGYANHKGIDFITRGATGNTYGKEIRAAADGVVYSAEYHYSWGNNVYINHGNGVYTRYAHCSRMIVSPGQTVKQGQVIAYVGNTGNVYPRPSASNPHAGAHLHFEVWVNGTRVNPSPWLP